MDGGGVDERLNDRRTERLKCTKTERLNAMGLYEKMEVCVGVKCCLPLQHSDGLVIFSLLEHTCIVQILKKEN